MELRWRGLELCLVVVSLATIFCGIQAEEKTGAKKEFVITLDHSNFSDVVSKHDFILVEFYAPWCGFCKRLAPQYEKAAATLSKHEPPITLAKVDATIDQNREHFQSKFDIRGFPTLKIFRNGGNLVHTISDNPQSADEIVQLVNKFLGPASVQIKSFADASKFIDERKTFVAGVFTKFEGEEYENFTKLADKLRSQYQFGHTLDPKFLPRGDSYVKGPFVRFLKPFDERFADSKNFDLDALEKFIEEEDVPLVVTFTENPSTYLRRIFSDQERKKIMMVLDMKSKNANDIKSKFNDIATLLKGRDKGFLIGDLKDSKTLLEYFKLDHSHSPFIFILESEVEKYLETNLKLDQVTPWFRKYLDGKLEMFMRSQPIPLENNEAVKVVVYNSLQEMVFNSGQDVLLVFYVPRNDWKELAPILEEVATSYQKDPDILIAKFDKTQNDIPSKIFNVVDFPTMFFIKKNEEVIEYKGGKTKEDIVRFIEEHRSDKRSKSEAEIKSETEKTSDHVDHETVVSGKDEL